MHYIPLLLHDTPLLGFMSIKINNTEDLLRIFPNLNKKEPSYLATLLEYFQAVNLLAESGKGLEFNNKDNYHASIVMSDIFIFSKTEIKMFCGEFKSEVCDNEMYISSLENAIDSNKNIEIVFERMPNEDSKCYSFLINKKKERTNISLFKLNDTFVSKISSMSNLKLNHFTVGDETMFRYETDMDAFKAFCNFDDKDIASKLVRNFSILKLNSNKID